jgi:gliding motility-associated-like protein
MRSARTYFLLSCLSLFIGIFEVLGQGCPPNIGFETGNLGSWDAFDGSIARSNGALNMTLGSAQDGKHTIITNFPGTTAKDYYGGFPTSCPNGSGYSLKLGNDQTQAEAQGVSYTFTVPSTEGDYSIIYNYAVVFENPAGHQDWEQPKFMVKVFNVTDNKYETCGAFEFISAPNLPGFKESTVKRTVFYKEWAPITLKLPGYQGKTLRLEFTTNDCSRGGHFGYAYLDVNDNCTTPVTGNVFCTNITGLNLTAPYGFADYKWYTDDFSKLLGTDVVLTISPAPPPKTRLALVITPYPNQGCLDTLYTTIVKSLDPYVFKLADSVVACQNKGADVTDSIVTAGSSPGLKLSYFNSPTSGDFVASPKAIGKSGLIYVKATNSAGCADTKPLQVTVHPNPTLFIKQPAAACIPETINITDTNYTSGNDPNLKYTYWQDALAKTPVINPTKIAQTGNYFVLGTSQFGCSNIVPINTSISAPPNTSVTNYTACGSIPLDSITPTKGTDPSASFNYFFDSTALQSMPGNHRFTSSSNYFIKFTAPAGCSVIKKASVTINNYPNFIVTQPAPVKIPVTIDITTIPPPSSNWVYSYWQDSLCTTPLLQPKRVLATGKYFIKATTPIGCAQVQTINAVVNDADINPPNAFSPNSDGINDTWSIPLLDYYPNCTVSVFNRTGQQVFSSSGYSKNWDGKSKNKTTLPLGVYYYVIKLSGKHQAFAGSVSIFY